MSVRFTADNDQLRPMGRATSGVGGIRLRRSDSLLAMQVAQEGSFAVTVTDGGFAKRTELSEWTPRNRNIQGVRAMRLVSERGALVGALVCAEGDELFAIADSGVVIRTPVEQIRATGRDTMGVSLMGLGKGQSVVAVARAAERDDDHETPASDESDPGTGHETGETSQSDEPEGTLALTDEPEVSSGEDATPDPAAAGDGETEEDMR
jgi:DNA gyrase subunit A